MVSDKKSKKNNNTSAEELCKETTGKGAIRKGV